MWIADGWKDYEVIDCSGGEKLERWGKYILVRPDPQVIWDTDKKAPQWRKMNGHYHRSSKGGGEPCRKDRHRGRPLCPAQCLRYQDDRDDERPQPYEFL